MKRHKIDGETIFGCIWLGILILLIVGCIVFAIFRTWVFFNYGDTPVTELPAWVWWIMQGGAE